MGYTRRGVLAGLGLAGLEALMPPLVKKAAAFSAMVAPATGSSTCPFRLAVINDEITQDFEKACQIVSGEFGLRWIELRSMWNKNVTELDAKELDAQDPCATQAASDRHCQPAVQDRLARRPGFASK
jgi:aspartate aminotransferase-like enzyme